MTRIVSELHYHKAAVDYFSALVDAGKRALLGPADAFCEWFDAFYAPADNPRSYNPGVYESGLREWESCFSIAELEAMAEFHAYFESIEDGFSVDRPYAEIEADLRWRGLIAAAAKALATFAPSI